jgi:hypothetical protein
LILVIVLAAAGSVVGLVAVAGKLLAPGLALHALTEERVSLWKAACCASTLFSWAISLLAVEWLVVLASLAWSSTPTGEITLYVVAGGLVVWYLTDRLPGIRKAYWRAIHDTLAGGIAAVGSETKRRAFNVDRIVVLGGGETAKLALARILAAE